MRRSSRLTLIAANRPLRRLQLSTAATSLGKWAFQLTLGVYAFRKGGATAVGLVALVQAVPATLAAPMLGIAADRYPRQRVLLVTNGLRGSLLALIALAVDANAPVAWVFALAALFSVVSTANQPARAALIPTLARSPVEVSLATALMGSIDTASFLVGAGLGGILLASSSVSFVIALCALSYALATFVMFEIPLDARPRSVPEHPVAELVAGLRTVLSVADLRLAVGVIATLSLIDGVSSVLVIVVAIDLLHIGTAGIGFLNIARGAGGILGGLLAFALLGRSRMSLGLIVGSLTLGVGLALTGLVPSVPLGLIAWAGLGVGYLLVKVSGLTLVQRLSGDRVLARVLAVLETIFVATIGLGAILTPALVSLLGIRGTLLLAGGALPLVILLRISAVRRLQITTPVSDAAFALLRRCPVFAPLPLATAEGLAARLVALQVPAGGEIITQGELGDRFYLIEEGAVEVLQGGIVLRRQGPGDSFGEIALLRDVPRTATVRALVPTRLLALEREPFLVSVTGHADSRQAADEVTDRFLAASEAVH
jgi:Cyclic nucleotide-binding domain/Major Facilitator Superfamily